jgi:hypothetical protein
VHTFRLPVILPLIATVASVLVVVKLAAGERLPATVDLEPGRIAGLRARLQAGGRPGATGRLTLTTHELVWSPDDPSLLPWRASLAAVEVIARPPLAPGRLVLVIGGRTVDLAVDRPVDRSDCTGAWFADLVETATVRTSACRSLRRQARVVGLLRLSAAAELVEGDGGGDPDVERVGGAGHRDADPAVGRLQRCVRQPGPLGAE